MKHNEKCNISHAPLHRLKRYSVLNAKCIELINPEVPEKYNNTEIKSGDFCLKKIKQMLDGLFMLYFDIVYSLNLTTAIGINLSYVYRKKYQL